VLSSVHLSVFAGELASIIGPSGSGKSTLLNIIGLLDQPSTGQVHLLGQDTAQLDDDRLTELRGQKLGFIFQFHHLIGALSAAENVMLPLSIAQGSTLESHRKRAREALDLVGLADRADALPRQLSGGQQQRVAIARALIGEPALVLADEPTGNLDTASSEAVFELMERLNRELSAAFLIVTHDPRIADRTRRVIELVDGRIVRDESI
jgi:lipoprotein-releasing system ATP-binding protein